MKNKSNYVLDVKGLYCPEPVMMLHNKVREMKNGEIVHLISTDPSTQRDIPKFCVFLGHTLLEKCDSDGLYEYYISKGQLT